MKMSYLGLAANPYRPAFCALQIGHNTLVALRVTTKDSHLQLLLRRSPAGERMSVCVCLPAGEGMSLEEALPQ